jgi:hypothetical protein
MKYLTFSFIALLFSSSVILAQTIPSSVVSQIKQNAQVKYPDDYEMQEYLINKQVEAFHKVQSYEAVDLPYTVLEKILNSAIRKYPDDYEMQEYTINKQVNSYRRMRKSSPEPVVVVKKKSRSNKESPSQVTSSISIPAEILNEIKKRHEIKFPDDYSMQRIMVNSDVKAYKELKTYSDGQVPSEILKRILEKRAQEFPGNFSMQRIMVNSDVKAYKELH